MKLHISRFDGGASFRCHIMHAARTQSFNQPAGRRETGLWPALQRPKGQTTRYANKTSPINR